MDEMTKKQSGAMRVLRALGKQGGSITHIAELTKISANDVRRLFAILAEHNLLSVENDTAKLTSKFVKDVPLWKEMKQNVMMIEELQK